MKHVKEYSVAAIVSGVIGICVALPFIQLFETGVHEYILKSFISGFIIGVLSKTVLAFFYRNVRDNTFQAFFAVIITISAVTYLATYVMGLRNILFSALIVLIADIAGVITTYISYNYAKRINDKLFRAQLSLKETLARRRES